MKLEKEAEKIIKKNIYLSLATSDGSVCWNSPLYYCLDENLNIYFNSDKKAKHSMFIRKNPYVSCSIFNSTLPPEKVNGVQFDGLACEVKLRQLPKAIETIYKRKESRLFKLRMKKVLDPRTYIKWTNFRIYRIKPLHFYILDPKVIKTDKRVEVALL